MVAALIIFGSIFSVVGIAMIITRIRLYRNCTVQTEGIIFDIKKKKDESHETDTDGKTRSITKISYFPIYQYYADGRTITRKSVVGSGRKPKIGSVVTVFYNPCKADEYYVAEDRPAQYGGLFFLFGGIIFILGGLFI